MTYPAVSPAAILAALSADSRRTIASGDSSGRGVSSTSAGDSANCIPNAAISSRRRGEAEASVKAVASIAPPPQRSSATPSIWCVCGNISMGVTRSRR